ncbi:MAG: DUF2764 family protein [Parachlamydiales bacterium]|nr:DUF2764 family protein [Parachlamydiales bacterium]
MNRYYFLACALPEIKIGEVPEFSFEECLHLVELNVLGEDKKKINCLRQYVDIRNLKPFFWGKPIDARGTLSEKEVEQALLVQDFFPPFVFDFLDRYESTDERINNFAFLYTEFFRYAKGVEGFISSYFSFERELRLILLTLRAKKMGRDIVKELQFEDMLDTFIMYILMQKESPTFEPPQEYIEAKEIFERFYTAPKEMELQFSLYRQRKVEELIQNQLFTVDWILGYLVQLWLAVNWVSYEPNKGKELVTRLRYG